MGLQRNYSAQTKWRNAGSITASQAALTTAQRDVPTAEALGATKVVTIKPDNKNPYAFLWRFRSDGSNNDANILEVYAARGSDDDYHRIGQLTVTQGQQPDGDSASIFYADTITPASEDALFDGEESNLTDMIGHYYVRTLGFDRFLFVASTLATTTCYVDYCELAE